MSDINSYFGSKRMLEDLYIDGWYKIGDGLAKDLGTIIYWLHLISTRSKRIYLIIKHRLL